MRKWTKRESYSKGNAQRNAGNAAAWHVAPWAHSPSPEALAELWGWWGWLFWVWAASSEQLGFQVGQAAAAVLLPSSAASLVPQRLLGRWWALWVTFLRYCHCDQLPDSFWHLLFPRTGKPGGLAAWWLLWAFVLFHCVNPALRHSKDLEQ